MREGEHGFCPMGRWFQTFIPIVTSNPLWKKMFVTIKEFLKLEMTLADVRPQHGKMYTEEVVFYDETGKVIFNPTVHVVFVDSAERLPRTIANCIEILKIDDNTLCGVALLKACANANTRDDPSLLKIVNEIHQLLPGAGVGIL